MVWNGAGMDPIARRFMWDIISRITTTDRECSVILTTHSMEEAEALCNNIGIMVSLKLMNSSTMYLISTFVYGLLLKQIRFFVVLLRCAV